MTRCLTSVNQNPSSTRQTNGKGKKIPPNDEMKPNASIYFKKKKEETKCYCACRLPLINHLLAMVFTVKRVACVCVRAFLEVEGGGGGLKAFAQRQ
jgi:hypothetical protein